MDVFLFITFQLQLLWTYWVFTSFSWFWKFYVPIWALPILAPTCFLEVISPRYNPGTISINWNMRNISFHSWCLFSIGIFSWIALHVTWKQPHVHCKHKIFLTFGFALITYIPFHFFSLLYNSSSFYQCLHFVWHLVMYKLLTKILLSPSFCLKCSIPY